MISPIRLIRGSLFLWAVLVLASAALAQIEDEDKGGAGDCDSTAVQIDVRPNASGPPTDVSIGFRMVDLTEINDVRQTLTGDFAVEIGPGGQVTYLQRYYGSLASYHNLSDFPFDKQKFVISMFAWYPDRD